MIKKGAIIQSLKIVLLVISVYVAYFSYVKYQDSQHKEVSYQFGYNKQVIDFTSIWSDGQFEKSGSRGRLLEFSVVEREGLIRIGKNTKQQDISFENLQIEIQDAKQISTIELLNQKNQIIKISSRFFTLVYSIANNVIVYEKIHFYQSDESLFVDQQGRLWVLSHPNYNIILVRVYGSQFRGLLNTYRYATKEKIQLVKEFEQFEQIIKVKLLTFSRNFIVFQFNKKTFELNSQEDFKSHAFSYLLEKFANVEIQLSQKLVQLETFQVLQNFLFKLSFGRAGKQTTPKPERELELDYSFEAVDEVKGIVFETNSSYNSSSLVSFGQVLLPFRTTAFMSKADQAKLMPFDQLLNKSRTDLNLPKIDVKLYGIKSKNLEIFRGKTGFYRLIPDSSVHFMTFNENFLSFYPQENVNPEDFYIVRIPTGGIAIKANQIKGIFEQVPIPDPNAIEINVGYSKQEIYHKQTTNGVELAPSIYEAHVVHKGLFVKAYKNRLELITTLNGKSILTHYLNKKDNYQYTTSFIENNQFWVFEHQIQHNPLITKYQLFINASSPKTTLSIKRTYQLDITGKITRVQKCIDYFYYFTYMTDDNKFGVARIHHALMSNRQARPDQNYAGAFEKMMVIPNIQRNTKLSVTSSQEQLLKVQFSIGEEIVKNWVELQLRHQYEILPIRAFAYKNQYYIMNIRKLLVNAFDSQIQRIKSELYVKILVGTGGFALILLFFIALTSNSASSTSKPAEGVPKAEPPAATTKPGKKNKRE